MATGGTLRLIRIRVMEWTLLLSPRVEDTAPRTADSLTIGFYTPVRLCLRPPTRPVQLILVRGGHRGSISSAACILLWAIEPSCGLTTMLVALTGCRSDSERRWCRHGLMPPTAPPDIRETQPTGLTAGLVRRWAVRLQ